MSTPAPSTTDLTIHFASPSFRPLQEDLMTVANLRAMIPHEVGFNSNAIALSFHDGTFLEFRGRMAKGGHFHCAPWMLGHDPETRRAKIYQAGA